MSPKDPKAVVRLWFEESNKGKAAAVAVVDKLCASRCVLHSSTDRDYSVEEYKKYTSDLFNAMPDTKFTIGDMIAEEDKVAVRIATTGTHKGEFMGVPPTNRKLTMWMIHIYHITGGKIVEGWSRTDTFGMMQQLGLVSAPKKGR